MTADGTVGDRDEPTVTVAICTRNRGDSIVRTLESVLACDGRFDVVVIDQSTDDRTCEAIAHIVAAQPRITYVRSDEVGVSRARNQALRTARGEIVVMTDDDCAVPVSWIRTHLDVLGRSDRIALTYTDVVDPVDASDVFVPQSVADRDFTVRSLREWRATDGINVGIGASCAMRRQAILDLGGYDIRLGPGADLRAGEDTDLAVRVLLAGHEIGRSTRSPVDHYGGRTADEFRTITRVSMFAVGTICAKLLRRRPLAGGLFLLRLGYSSVLAPAVRSLRELRRPPVLGRAVSLMRGLVVGLRTPMDEFHRFRPG